MTFCRATQLRKTAQAFSEYDWARFQVQDAGLRDAKVIPTSDTQAKQRIELPEANQHVDVVSTPEFLISCKKQYLRNLGVQIGVLTIAPNRHALISAFVD